MLYWAIFTFFVWTVNIEIFF